MCVCGVLELVLDTPPLWREITLEYMYILFYFFFMHERILGPLLALAKMAFICRKGLGTGAFQSISFDLWLTWLDLLSQVSSIPCSHTTNSSALWLCYAPPSVVRLQSLVWSSMTISWVVVDRHYFINLHHIVKYFTFETDHYLHL